jgi:hypothetical protein
MSGQAMDHSPSCWPLTLWDLWWNKCPGTVFFFQYFGFPLQVSFHQCFIIIHSCITNTVWSQPPTVSQINILNIQVQRVCTVISTNHVTMNSFRCCCGGVTFNITSADADNICHDCQYLLADVDTAQSNLFHQLTPGFLMCNTEQTAP